MPARIVELHDSTATISVDGILRDVDVSLIEQPRLGDYVLVHAGFAIHRWDQSDVDELQAIRAATDLRETVT
ncbi:MAG TPA: HypC/HybG/HupF family hydrogenase formation chaperone [Verrucomicrobiae bacterium]|nr:HypC/HybG/HupF family hydrogenase formation chaperone [Verrucomicrobiae bacterium]